MPVPGGCAGGRGCRTLEAVPLSFAEEPGARLVAVTLTEEDGTIVQTRVVSKDELPRITARARALVARGDATAFVTLDELIDGSADPDEHGARG